MKNSKMSKYFRTSATILLTLCLSSQFVFANEKVKSASKKDKTGTNPINFQQEIRFYNEYTSLNTSGDGKQNVATLEYRTPLLDGKWQYRLKVKHNSVLADTNNDGNDNIDESGLGDIDMRFLTILNMDMETKTAWAAGLEIFLNTASEDTLGSGTTSLGPQIFYVKFLDSGLFAPGFQYKFSVDEDDGRSKTDQSIIDLNYLLMAKDKKSWFFTDPQIIIDNEKSQEFAIVDFEFGWMANQWFEKLKGHSFYVRPSIGVGVDRVPRPPR